MGVDDSLHGTGDGGALSFVEMRGEVPVDPAEVDRRSTAQRPPALWGETGERGAPVTGVRPALDEPLAFEVVDEPADPTSGQDYAPAEVVHAEASSRGRVQLQQHVVPRQRHPTGVSEIAIDGPDNPVLGDEHAAPRGYRIIVLSHHTTVQGCVRLHVTVG